jgi:hypothetical protein
VEVRAHETKQVSSGSCAVCSSSFGMFSKGLHCSGCDLRFHPAAKCIARMPPCGHQIMPPPNAAPMAAGTPTDLPPPALGIVLCTRGTHASVPPRGK